MVERNSSTALAICPLGRRREKLHTREGHLSTLRGLYASSERDLPLGSRDASEASIHADSSCLSLIVKMAKSTAPTDEGKPWFRLVVTVAVLAGLAYVIRLVVKAINEGVE